MRMVKTFFDETLTVNFYVDDIFRSQKDQWTMYGDHSTLTKDSYHSAREIGSGWSINSILVIESIWVLVLVMQKRAVSDRPVLQIKKKLYFRSPFTLSICLCIGSILV